MPYGACAKYARKQKQHRLSGGSGGGGLKFYPNNQFKCNFGANRRA